VFEVDQDVLALIYCTQAAFEKFTIEMRWNNLL
jgi:hypothetical protein